MAKTKQEKMDEQDEEEGRIYELGLIKGENKILRQILEQLLKIKLLEEIKDMTI